jgi:hypothetical protein
MEYIEEEEIIEPCDYKKIEIYKNGPVDKKFNIFLDLDNTLLSAIPLEEMKWTKKDTEKSVKFDFHDMEDYYVIFERPGVQPFLDYLFENFNVNVWSAASKDYVAFIVDEIIQNPKKYKPSVDRKLSYVLFSYHCNVCKKLCNKGIKDLKLIWDKFKLPGFSKDNTIIIDDLDKVKNINKKNCINVKDFEFDNDYSEYDISKDEEDEIDYKEITKDNEEEILGNKEKELERVQKILEHILEAHNNDQIDEDNVIDSRI